MPSSSAAAAQGPDFAAAKWFRNQMAYKAGAAHVGNDQGAYTTLCCKCLLESSDTEWPDRFKKQVIVVFGMGAVLLAKLT